MDEEASLDSSSDISKEAFLRAANVRAPVHTSPKAYRMYYVYYGVGNCAKPRLITHHVWLVTITAHSSRFTRCTLYHEHQGNGRY